MHFIDSHPLHGAFLANKLDRLSDLIVEQGDALLGDAGLAIPSRTVSLLLLIGDKGPMSVADIAGTFGQPHQLVTQRADVLIGLGLVERSADPADARRKLLSLLPAGRRHHADLTRVLTQAAAAMAALFDELGCDLADVAVRAMATLHRTSLRDRVRAQSAASAALAGVR